MSDDLISRQAAIDFIKEHSYPVRYDNTSIEQGMTITGIEEALNEIPNIQSKQKTGRWEHDGGHFANRWICSQCGYKFYFEKSEAKYCPNCGAKMESDNNDS